VLAILKQHKPEMITEPESTPARVCILGWSRSRSQYFRFEPEQEPVPSEISDLCEISDLFLFFSYFASL